MWSVILLWSSVRWRISERVKTWTGVPDGVGLRRLRRHWHARRGWEISRQNNQRSSESERNCYAIRFRFIFTPTMGFRAKTRWNTGLDPRLLDWTSGPLLTTMICGCFVCVCVCVRGGGGGGWGVRLTLPLSRKQMALSEKCLFLHAFIRISPTTVHIQQTIIRPRVRTNFVFTFEYVVWENLSSPLLQESDKDYLLIKQE